MEEEKKRVFKELTGIFKEPETEEEKEKIAKETAESWVRIYGADEVLRKKQERIEREKELIRQGKSTPERLEMLLRVFSHVEKMKKLKEML